MVIIIKNAITGGIIAVATSEEEANYLAQLKGQPYIFEQKLLTNGNEACIM